MGNRMAANNAQPVMVTGVIPEYGNAGGHFTWQPIAGGDAGAIATYNSVATAAAVGTRLAATADLTFGELLTEAAAAIEDFSASLLVTLTSLVKVCVSVGKVAGRLFGCAWGIFEPVVGLFRQLDTATRWSILGGALLLLTIFALHWRGTVRAVVDWVENCRRRIRDALPTLTLVVFFEIVPRFYFSVAIFRVLHLAFVFLVPTIFSTFAIAESYLLSILCSDDSQTPRENRTPGNFADLAALTVSGGETSRSHPSYYRGGRYSSEFPPLMDSPAVSHRGAGSSRGSLSPFPSPRNYGGSKHSPIASPRNPKSHHRGGDVHSSSGTTPRGGEPDRYMIVSSPRGGGHHGGMSRSSPQLPIRHMGGSGIMTPRSQSGGGAILRDARYSTQSAAEFLLTRASGLYMRKDSVAMTVIPNFAGHHSAASSPRSSRHGKLAEWLEYWVVVSLLRFFLSFISVGISSIFICSKSAASPLDSFSLIEPLTFSECPGIVQKSLTPFCSAHLLLEFFHVMLIVVVRQRNLSLLHGLRRYLCKTIEGLVELFSGVKIITTPSLTASGSTSGILQRAWIQPVIAGWRKLVVSAVPVKLVWATRILLKLPHAAFLFLPTLVLRPVYILVSIILPSIWSLRVLEAERSYVSTEGGNDTYHYDRYTDMSTSEPSSPTFRWVAYFAFLTVFKGLWISLEYVTGGHLPLALHCQYILVLVIQLLTASPEAVGTFCASITANAGGALRRLSTKRGVSNSSTRGPPKETESKTMRTTSGSRHGASRIVPPLGLAAILGGGSSPGTVVEEAEMEASVKSPLVPTFGGISEEDEGNCALSSADASTTIKDNSKEAVESADESQKAFHHHEESFSRHKSDGTVANSSPSKGGMNSPLSARSRAGEVLIMNMKTFAKLSDSHQPTVTTVGDPSDAEENKPKEAIRSADEAGQKKWPVQDDICAPATLLTQSDDGPKISFSRPIIGTDFIASDFAETQSYSGREGSSENKEVNPSSPIGAALGTTTSTSSTTADSSFPSVEPTKGLDAVDVTS